MHSSTKETTDVFDLCFMLCVLRYGYRVQYLVWYSVACIEMKDEAEQSLGRFEYSMRKQIQLM